MKYVIKNTANNLFYNSTMISETEPSKANFVEREHAYEMTETLAQRIIDSDIEEGVSEFCAIVPADESQVKLKKELEETIAYHEAVLEKQAKDYDELQVLKDFYQNDMHDSEGAEGWETERDEVSEKMYFTRVTIANLNTVLEQI